MRSRDVIIAHVGDSRAYLVDGGNGMITQITSDHSFVEALLAAGHITQEQAAEHPMRNVLYRALGQAEDMDVDIYQSRLHVHDRLVLCSDGLTRHVKPDEIASLALEYDNPDEASQALIDLANARGGEDNVSVIVILVEEEDAGGSAGVESMFAAEEDEDDTLVLGKPLLSREDWLSRGRKEDPQPDDSSSESSPPAMSLNKQKMCAERVSDTVEVPSVNKYETQKTLFERVPPPLKSHPPAYDDNSEGHDTRPPEQ